MKNNSIYLTILFLLLMMVSCGTSVPENILCTKDAKILEENYVKYRCDTCDNRVISFTYEQIKEYLEYIEARADKLAIKEDKLGFRVYLGAKHTEDFKEEDRVKGDFKEIGKNEGTFYTTIFFVPTINRKGSTDSGDYENLYEIAPFNYGSSKRPPTAYIPVGQCQIANHTH